VNPILQPLAAGFRLSVALRGSAYKRGLLKIRRLNRPVVSVGNLTVGGTGKTPLVAFLAEMLLRRGWNPSILTRGYGRRGAKLIAVAPKPERAANPREVGDEPAWLAKALPEVPLVVCADRYKAGLVAEESFNVNVHLLDDGFQHLSLARDIDVVLVDITQEFSNRALLPAGPLREPRSALARAQVIVLTRAELNDASSREREVARINPKAKVFHSTTRLLGLVSVESGAACALQSLERKSVFAFCGLGNPEAFFASLRAREFNLMGQAIFPDHHVYSAAELNRLSSRASASRAVALLTTEKDALNFPPTWSAELPVLATVVKAEVREHDAFEQVLCDNLEASRRAESPTAVTVVRPTPR